MATLLPVVPASAAPGPVAPVVPIVAPVLDIVFAGADLQRTARVENGPRRTRITLDSTVLFARDSPTINRRARGRLDDVAEQLTRSGPGRLSITGYTDDLGSAAHGLTLSRQRAQAVAEVLRGDLPKADYPFSVKGRGEADPAVPNTSERNRKINRRVVVVYTRR
ncbi:OmpA family protein [Microlunatus flavus]|uniref:OmpA family protein n=1 Tax=Microlunatus flavus TaxID=1036181 RepID=UPI0011137673|nr:OmpA family protein [Microlunatus flavus]